MKVSKGLIIDLNEATKSILDSGNGRKSSNLFIDNAFIGLLKAYRFENNYNEISMFNK